MGSSHIFLSKYNFQFQTLFVSEFSIHHKKKGVMKGLHVLSLARIRVALLKVFLFLATFFLFLRRVLFLFFLNFHLNAKLFSFFEGYSV
jgi:hypothetical protein